MRGVGPFLLQDIKTLPYVQVGKGNFDSGKEEHVHAGRTMVWRTGDGPNV